MCLKWIGSCVILHNLLLNLDDDVEARWIVLEDENSSDEEPELRTRDCDIRRKSAGKKKRLDLMRAILEEEREDH
jgi:hypothetical protein